jgi:hypothetical protein
MDIQRAEQDQRNHREPLSNHAVEYYGVGVAEAVCHSKPFADRGV